MKHPTVDLYREFLLFLTHALSERKKGLAPAAARAALKGPFTMSVREVIIRVRIVLRRVPAVVKFELKRLIKVRGEIRHNDNRGRCPVDPLASPFASRVPRLREAKQAADARALWALIETLPQE